MALLKIFLRHIDEDKLTNNFLAFQQIDGDHSGQLEEDEMALAIQDLSLIVPDLNFTSEDMQEVFTKLDLDHTGLITYT